MEELLYADGTRISRMDSEYLGYHRFAMHAFCFEVLEW